MRRFVALSPKVAEESISATPAETRLLLHLVQHCFLLGIAPQDGPVLLKFVKAMPADLQFLWTEVIRARLARTDLLRFGHEPATDECRLPEESGAPVLQLSNSSVHKICSVCNSSHEPWATIGSVADVQTCVVRQSESILSAGTSRTTAYEQDLQSIARVSKNVVIVDRYAGVRLKDYGDESGVAWLTERLISDGVKRVVLVTSKVKTSAHSIEQAAMDLTDPLVRSALKVETQTDAKFRDHAHDRFMLLHAGRVSCTFSIGKGVEVFENPLVSQDSSFSICSDGVVGRILTQLSVDASQHFV